MKKVTLKNRWRVKAEVVASIDDVLSGYQEVVVPNTADFDQKSSLADTVAHLLAESRQMLEAKKSSGHRLT